MVKVFIYLKELLLTERIRSSGSKFFPLREVPISKRDIIVENHCLIQRYPFDVRNFFKVLATSLVLEQISQLCQQVTNKYLNLNKHLN